MPDLEKVIKGLRICSAGDIHSLGGRDCTNCPYYPAGYTGCTVKQLLIDVLSLLKAQEPRVMTLEEVVKHYSLPPVVLDDIDWQEDYLQDIEPLYFDFPVDDSWAVHWRKYDEVNKYLDGWKADYGKTWRCWTSRPTDEQREATQWAK